VKELSPKDYVAWCENPDNGLIKEFVQNDLKLTCQYNTSAYSVLKQSDPNALNEAEINENIEEISDLVHFKLKFENTATGNFLRDNYTTAEEFNVRSTYLSYDIRTDLKLINGTDTSICVLNHHERTYGNTPYETILLSFQKPTTTNDAQNDLELIFNDQVFGLGRVKFFFSKDDLASIPELVFE
jgi:hypothetical protein